MSLDADLLEQAVTLARLDPRRPKQANLRRAVSSAYYALFHLLTGDAAGLYADEFEVAARICRTHNHGDMKKVSAQFAGNKLPKALQPRGSYTTPPELKVVADAFVRLQQFRHEADYDLTRTFSRNETHDILRQAQGAFEAWDRVKKTDDARLYLACFLLWDRWDKEQR
jgi:hypothetical protein